MRVCRVEYRDYWVKSNGGGELYSSDMYLALLSWIRAFIEILYEMQKARKVVFCFSCSAVDRVF